MRDQTKRMNNEISNVNNRKMINNDLYKVLLEITEVYALAYCKTADDDNEYDYTADTFAIETIFDEIIEYIYRDYQGISTRILNKLMAEFNRIRDHYKAERHIEYKF